MKNSGFASPPVPATENLAHATNVDPRPIVPGGNLRLWVDLLGAPIVWLIQFELIYALVNWACSGGHRLFLHLVWIPFLLLILGVGALSFRDWSRLSALSAVDRGMARCRFMAGLGVVISSLFALATVAQAIAIFIIDPCAH